MWNLSSLLCDSGVGVTDLFICLSGDLLSPYVPLLRGCMKELLEGTGGLEDRGLKEDGLVSSCFWLSC